MNTYRNNAIIVGVLFILGFAGIPSVVLTMPILSAPDYLLKIAAGSNQLITGVFFQLIMAAACAGIAIGLYPVLRKNNESLALVAVGFRIIEAVLYFVSALAMLSLLVLGQEYIKGGTPDTSYFQTIGILLRATSDWAQTLGAIPFCLGAFMYYLVFYQSGLIPRWLSGWGLIAITLHFLGTLLTMFGIIDPFSSAQVILALPIAANEIVLAIWLIVKGFNSSAINTRATQTNN